MGFQDRGYSSGRSAYGAGWTAVAALLVANVAIFVANMVGPPDPNSLNDWLALRGDLPRHPWRIWELVTYGFAHAVPRGGALPWHIIGNMLSLWFFGRAVETLLGRAEFLRFYVTALVVAGLTWLASVALRPAGFSAPLLIGASGAVTAVLAVFVWNFPHVTVLIWGVLPLPAWALGILYVFWDVQGTTNAQSNVAHIAHLGGAAFGLLYAWQGWSLEGLADPMRRVSGWRRLRGGGRYRVFRPDTDGEDDDATLQQQADRVLEKISRSGSASLTPRERETLERASRRLKDRDRA
ncbi:MAG: rhomboid family intramembrane serine protease [Planctomycetaceae bacterium]